MPGRARMAFAGAAVGVLCMVITWFAVHDIAVLRQADANVLAGFRGLASPRLDRFANFVAHLCDPVPFVILALIPVTIALVRGRPGVAAVLVVLLIGANETTELIKPLLAGNRDPVPGLYLSDATWPSGHATAAMSLALAMVIGVPARVRPVVAAVMATFAVAIVYSFLELGWHYPSDVLGGFEVSSTWALACVGALWTYEARRPRSVTPGVRFSVGEALAPAALLIACAAVLVAVLVLAHPHSVLDYARAHQGFVVGAAAIGVLSFVCASGLSLVLRRPPESGGGPGGMPLQR